MSPILASHVAAGGIALAAGYIAIYSTKGAPLHRRVGLGFVIAMVAMATLALLYMAIEGRIILVNVLASSISAYLVLTSLMTVRPPSARQRLIDVGGAMLAVAIGVGGLTLGYVATQRPRGLLDGIPAFPYFMFGTVATLAWIGDLRMIRGGSAYAGTRRLRRHLWRMSFALFIAAMSFFIGQADELPRWMRIYPLLAVPPLAVLGTMGWWMWRLRARRLATGSEVATIGVLIPALRR